MTKPAQRSILLWLVTLGIMEGFCPVNAFVSNSKNHPTHVSASAADGLARPGTLLKMDQEEESEWYTPPPQAKESPRAKLPKGAAPDIRELKSHVDMMEFLGEDDRLCIIKFYASWCKSCQKFAVHYEKMGREKADWIDAKSGKLLKRNNIRMASIEYSKNQALCKSLGVEKLPTVFLYSGGRKLTEVSVGASKFTQVKEAVEQYSSFSSHDRDFVAQMEEGHNMIQANVLNAEVASAPETSAPEPAAAESTSEERRAKIEALLSTSTARRSTRKKWWTHQTK